MLIEIHAIQNHSPGNLNRDDLGAPKTCFFGGVLRSRISSQCLKRSIRMGKEFEKLVGGVRTRQLARLISEKSSGKPAARKRAEKVLELCGFKAKKGKGQGTEDGEPDGTRSAMLVYTTMAAIEEMAALLDNESLTDENLSKQFGELIATRVAVPDMALSGRMLEPDKSAKEIWKTLDTTVEASLQVAHAFSTHEARPEVDYYVAADDIPGDDAGAGYVDESMFHSACFYKYFSINWEQLVKNLSGNERLAAHTVGAFIQGSVRSNPTGKQNSFAAHNPPDGVLVEIKESPTSYANAFAAPVSLNGERDIIAQSISQLGHYMHDLDTGYGRPRYRIWFSPNQRNPLNVRSDGETLVLADKDVKSLDDLISETVSQIGHEWIDVQREIVGTGARS